MKYLISFIFTLSTTTLAYSAPISFNYKNINAIGSVICEVTAKGQINKNTILVHNLSIDKKTFGPKKNQASYEVSGTCSSKYSLKSKKIISLGDEINFELDLTHQLAVVKATVGINEVELIFKNNNLIKITNQDPLGLMSDKEIFKVNAKSWANSNSSFDFSGLNKKIKMNVEQLAIKEVASTLLIKNKTSMSKWSNIWHYNSQGCTLPVAVKFFNCDKIKIN